MFKQIVTVLALCQLAALVQAQLGWGFGSTFTTPFYNRSSQTSAGFPDFSHLIPQLPNIWDILANASSGAQQVAQNAINTAQDVANRSISGNNTSG